MNQRRNASSKSQPTKPLITKNPDISKQKGYKSQKSNFFSSEKNIFTLCLAFRIANSLLIQTYFNPDEHWQALEVAHRIVFGYGHLTWEWRKGIRSYFHPLLFAVLYKVLALFGLDTPWFMAHAPRLLQALFSAVGDLYFYRLSNAIFGNFVAKWALFSQLANWFMFFCFNRTLSNSLETVLTLVGLYYWPCMRASPSKAPLVLRKWGLAIAALACAIRPTSAITWVYVGLLELAVTRDRLKFLVLEVVPIGALVLGLSCLLDRLLYGSWVIVPLNFLKFNFLSSGGDYYGTHKWHCIQGHKEFRFVLPMLPIALMFSGYSLSVMAKSDSDTRRKGSPNSHMKRPSKVGFAIFVLLATNIPMALYMSLVHQTERN